MILNIEKNQIKKTFQVLRLSGFWCKEQGEWIFNQFSFSKCTFLELNIEGNRAGSFQGKWVWLLRWINTDHNFHKFGAKKILMQASKLVSLIE